VRVGEKIACSRTGNHPKRVLSWTLKRVAKSRRRNSPREAFSRIDVAKALPYQVVQVLRKSDLGVRRHPAVRLHLARGAVRGRIVIERASFRSARYLRQRLSRLRVRTSRVRRQRQPRSRAGELPAHGFRVIDGEQSQGSVQRRKKPPMIAGTIHIGGDREGWN
jgi:hypothetical protein